MRSFSYDVGNISSGDTVEVKTDFMTDFASIPRLLWIFLPCWGKYGNAAVIHDWLYWAQKRSRKKADGIMLEGMKVLKVPLKTGDESNRPSLISRALKHLRNRSH